MLCFLSLQIHFEVFPNFCEQRSCPFPSLLVTRLQAIHSSASLFSHRNIRFLAIVHPRRIVPSREENDHNAFECLPDRWQINDNRQVVLLNSASIITANIYHLPRLFRIIGINTTASEDRSLKLIKIKANVKTKDRLSNPIVVVRKHISN